MTTEKQEETLQQEKQAETPTNEELIKQYEDKISQLTKQYEEKDKGLRTAHSTLTEKDREIKRLADFNSKIESIDQKIRILAAAQATGMRMDENTLDNMSPQAQQNLLSEFDKLDAQTKARDEQAKKLAEEQEYRSKADALWQEAQSLNLNEDILDRIEDSLMYGRLERAERLINRNRKEETKTETDIEKIIQERVEQELKKRGIEQEEKGLLDTDTAIPSGRNATQQDIIDRFASGDRSVSREDYEKAIGMES